MLNFFAAFFAILAVVNLATAMKYWEFRDFERLERERDCREALTKITRSICRSLVRAEMRRILEESP